jgi:hypothetical protein
MPLAMERDLQSVLAYLARAQIHFKRTEADPSRLDGHIRGISLVGG